MKKLVLSILFLFIFSLCSGQIIEFKATHVNFRFFNDTTQTFGRWGDWEETYTPIEMDLKEMTLIIFSEMKQTYSIVDLVDKVDNTTHKITIFKAKDTLGGDCEIKMIVIYFGNQRFVHIAWPNLELAYQIEKP